MGSFQFGGESHFSPKITVMNFFLVADLRPRPQWQHRWQYPTEYEHHNIIIMDCATKGLLLSSDLFGSSQSFQL